MAPLYVNLTIIQQMKEKVDSRYFHQTLLKLQTHKEATLAIAHDMQWKIALHQNLPL